MQRAIVAAVLALIVAGSARAVPAADAPLGIFWDVGRSTLVRVEPGSLRPKVGPRVDLANVTSWGFSPDRSRLALATMISDNTDVSSGRTRGSHRGQLPSLLLDRASSYWRNGI